MSRVICSWLMVGLLFSCIVGCNASASSPPEVLAPVSGTVTIDGKPVEGVMIKFLPTGRMAAHFATATTNSEGGFVMFNYQNKEGLPEGSYIVIFSLWVMPNGCPLTGDKTPADAHAREAIPAKWQEPGNAGEHNTVVVKGEDNDFEFKITTK